jgi:hypothetical protein
VKFGAGNSLNWFTTPFFSPNAIQPGEPSSAPARARVVPEIAKQGFF